MAESIEVLPFKTKLFRDNKNKGSECAGRMAGVAVSRAS